MFDSGTSVGEISGHSKTVNSVDIKPNRPFRAVTASDDLWCVTGLYRRSSCGSQAS